LRKQLGVLREFVPFCRKPAGLGRTSDWDEVEWFLSPHVLLDGGAPAGTLTAGPVRVLRAALIEVVNDV